MPSANRRSRKKIIAALRAAGGLQKANGFHVKPKEWALRSLANADFNFDHAIWTLQQHKEYHKMQAQKGLKEGSKGDVSEHRQYVTHVLAVKELEYLRQLGHDFWLPRAVKIFERDLFKKVGAAGIILSAEEKNAVRKVLAEDVFRLTKKKKGGASKSVPVLAGWEEYSKNLLEFLKRNEVRIPYSRHGRMSELLAVIIVNNKTKAKSK
ncbi:MAG: hypothetical protein NUV67_06050 [archaeon]|nr:hypothetical protein [archaeon]